MPNDKDSFDSLCITDHKLYGIRFKWTINNWDYVSMLGQGEKLSSCLFWCQEKPEIKCCINLYPDGIDRDARGYLSLFLEVKEVNGLPISETPCQIPSKFDLVLYEKRHNDVEMEVQFGKKHLQHVFNREENDWGFKRFVERSKLRGSTLSVVCSLDFILKGEYRHLCSSPGEAEAGDSLVQLSENFSKLLEAGDDSLSDLSICVGGTEFRAHKAVLAARSCVFKAMFAHSCRESATSRVEISDTCADTWRRVMYYLYTGCICKENRVEHLAEMLKVADKYEVNSLKAACGELLARQIRCENFTDILLLSHMHKAPELKRHCCQFMLHSSASLVAQPDWLQLQRCWPDLTSELLSSVLANNSPSC